MEMARSQGVVHLKVLNIYQYLLSAGWSQFSTPDSMFINYYLHAYLQTLCPLAYNIHDYVIQSPNWREQDIICIPIHLNVLFPIME